MLRLPNISRSLRFFIADIIDSIYDLKESRSCVNRVKIKAIYLLFNRFLKTIETLIKKEFKRIKLQSFFTDFRFHLFIIVLNPFYFLFNITKQSLINLILDSSFFGFIGGIIQFIDPCKPDLVLISVS